MVVDGSYIIGAWRSMVVKLNVLDGYWWLLNYWLLVLDGS